ncbi:putative DNA helicase chromatin remodeling SNF2 family [Helianthus debilis subsp. tardiflorus]
MKVPDEVRNKSSRKRIISLAQLYADKKESDIDGQASMQKRSGRVGDVEGDVESEEDKMEEDDMDSEEDDVGSEEDEMESSDDVEVENGNNIEDDDVEVENTHDKGVYVGVEEDESNSQSDTNLYGEADLWNEMSIGLESLKVISHGLYAYHHQAHALSSSSSSRSQTSFFVCLRQEIHPSSDQKSSEDGQECDHSYILKDDIGYVCRVCGLIQTPIDSIIEFQRPKSIRTYYYEGQKNRSGDASLDGVKLPETEFSVLEFTVHPRHQRQMKPHQVAGFNFLLSNLVSENPGGCILAHAPGSGKTFMLISFIQSFMAKYPDARPLVILPRGILGTWKKEFLKWQVEDLPLLDMYSLKAEGRTQQLEVLKKWANQRSILFLGYQHFSSIVCDNDTKPESVNCQEILLTRPSLLILDEGHTARNKQTNIYIAIDKVQTPRKVVLSGTLYQNNVTEVFNTLNLVRPKFLKMEKSKGIKRRILSMVEFKSHTKKDTENEFYELVKHTLLKDDNFKRKVAIIENLREMTNSVLHYYKGDLLDELPGLVDFSVFLKLTPNQVRAVSELKKVARNKPFKVSSDGSAIYVHPGLDPRLKNSGSKERNDEIDEKIDELLENVDGTEGVKAKFFINMLRLCESAGEKLLVFGQFLLPLKFLVGLTVKTKGWSVGKQIFMITGDHDNDERELAMDRIIILDVHLNPSVTRQAIGRAFRPGQMKRVYIYRLIAAESPEEEDHATCFKKESIAKMLFEWNEYCGHHDFKMETISVEDCDDRFLETACLNEDITAVWKRLAN